MPAPKLTVEVSNDQAVIYQLPPGKPDPNDSTKRVTQQPQKGFTCVNYALKQICDDKDENNQAIRKNISANRKNITKLSERYLIERQIVQAIITGIEEAKKQYPIEVLSRLSEQELTLGTTDHNDISTVLINEFTKWKKACLSEKTDSRKHENKYAILFQFAQQDMKKFVEEKFGKQMMTVMNEALIEYGIDVKTLKPAYKITLNQLNEKAQQYISETSTGSKIVSIPAEVSFFDVLNEAAQYVVIHDLLIAHEAKLSGLTMNSGKSDITIDDVMQMLRDNGPFAVSGDVGKAFYKPGAEFTKKIGDKEVYAFPAGGYTKEYTFGAHVVVVVGAIRKGYEGVTQDLICYNDPLSKSDPDKPRETMIVSLEKFKERTQQLAYFYAEGDQLKEIRYVYYTNPSLIPKPKKQVDLAQNQYAWFNCNKVAAAVAGAATAAVAAVVYGLSRS